MLFIAYAKPFGISVYGLGQQKNINTALNQWLSNYFPCAA